MYFLCKMFRKSWTLQKINHVNAIFWRLKLRKFWPGKCFLLTAFLRYFTKKNFWLKVIYLLVYRGQNKLYFHNPQIKENRPPLWTIPICQPVFVFASFFLWKKKLSKIFPGFFCIYFYVAVVFLIMQITCYFSKNFFFSQIQIS